MMLQYYIWLNELKGIQMRDKRLLVAYFGTPKKVYEASRLDLPEEYKEYQTFIKELKSNDLSVSESILKENQNKNIKVLTIDDPLYRAGARLEKNSPLVLYYKGKIVSNENQHVAVVGTRKATEYGKVATQLICMEYIEKESVIISGLATGIDRVAHETVIKIGGVTYAFVANGLDVCYPKENLELMEQIENQGAVISMFPIGVSPRKHHFIMRNEIISMWADEVVVVEGGAKSGAVITAEFALKNKKKVYAVPNNIFISSSDGCNNLLKKGAIPYLCNHDTINKQRKKRCTQKSEIPIIEMLKAIPLTIQELSKKLNLDYDKIQKELFMLELDDQVKFQSDGKWHYIGW